jgi:hypothetical protein
VVEGARLESVYRGNSIEGSNPSLSAINKSTYLEENAPLWHVRHACATSRLLLRTRW